MRKNFVCQSPFKVFDIIREYVLHGGPTSCDKVAYNLLYAFVWMRVHIHAEDNKFDKHA